MEIDYMTPVNLFDQSFDIHSLVNKNLGTLIGDLDLVISDVKKIKNKFIYSQDIVEEYIKTIFKAAFYIDIENTYSSFFIDFLEPALKNTYVKIEKNPINYFSENPFIDTFYSALMLYLRSNQFKYNIKYIIKHLPKVIKKFKYTIYTIDANTDKFLGHFVKFDFSDCIKPLLKTFDYKKFNFDVIHNTNASVVATDSDETIKFNNITQEDLLAIVVHASVSWIKSLTLQNLNNYQFDAHFDGWNNYYNKFAIDYSGFFTRNNQSLIDFLAKYQNVASDYKNDLFINPIKQIFIDDPEEGFKSENVMSSAIDTPRRLFNLIESMNRPSGNKLADISTDIIANAELLDRYEEVSLKCFDKMRKLYEDFKYNYEVLGYKDAELVMNISYHIFKSISEIVKLCTKSKMTTKPYTVSKPFLKYYLRSRELGSELNSEKLLEKYGSRHIKMVNDVDKYLDEIEEAYKEYFDICGSISLVIDKWENLIVSKIKTYANVSISDSVFQEFFTEFNGFSPKVFDVKFINSLMK